MSTRKILFPTDLSAGAERVRELALAFARKYGAEVLFFHAVLTHANELRQFGVLLSDFLGKLENEAERKLERETSQLREQGMVVRYEVLQAPSAFEAIVERTITWEPGLIVMAAHGRTGMPRWFLGSVAEKVLRHAPCSVATVRPDQQTRRAREGDDGFDRILVPVDFSDNSGRALAQARELVAENGSIVLHHVVHNPTLAGLASGEHLRLFSEEPTLPDRIRDQMKEWMEGKPFDPQVTEADDVAGSIFEMAEAKEADLIVVGARGQSDFEHFLTGSVAEKIVRASPIPVLTVR